MKVQKEKSTMNDKKAAKATLSSIGVEALTLIIKEFRAELEWFKVEIREMRSTVTLLRREYPPKRNSKKGKGNDRKN